MFANSSPGTDLGTGGDPNPTPAGGPLANGNSLFFTEVGPVTCDYRSLESLLDTGTYDFPHDITGNSIPEPAIAAPGLAGLGTLCIRLNRRVC